MALATRCPQCQTAFRVASDQLKLRAGLVRCGTCKEIFNGIENLLHPDENIAAVNGTSTPDTTPALEEVAPALSGQQPGPGKRANKIKTPGRVADNVAGSVVSKALQTSQPPSSATIASPVPSPPPGLLRAASVESPPSSGTSPASHLASQPSFRRALTPSTKPASTAFRKPARRTGAAPAIASIPVLVEEPDFIQREQLAQVQRRITRPLVWGLGIVLTLLLLLQLTYAMRIPMAAHFPQSRPVLEKACGWLGCSVGLPTEIELVSIESSEFQPLDSVPGKFLLNVLLRNRSSTVQAWPALELSVQDAGDKTIGRRVIMAAQFLPAGLIATDGFPANSEQAIKVQFDLSQLKASGYRVYLFYP